MNFIETSVHVAGGTIELLKGGSGSPIVVFHHDIGNPGWLPYYIELAEKHTASAQSCHY